MKASGSVVPRYWNLGKDGMWGVSEEGRAEGAGADSVTALCPPWTRGGSDQSKIAIINDANQFNQWGEAVNGAPAMCD